MARRRTFIASCCALTAACAFAGFASAASYTWKGSSGNFSNATNWNPTGVPGTGDDATLSSINSIVTLDNNPSLSDLTWANGTFASGAMTVTNTLTIAGSDSLAAAILTAKSITNQTGGGIELGGIGAQFINAGSYNASAGAIVANPGSSLLFNNTGTFNLALATAASNFSVSAPFANAGTVNAQTGNMILTGGDGGTTTGTFDISEGSAVSFSAGTFNFASNATTTGGGTANFSGATINIGANDVFLSSNVALSNGTVTGTSGALNLNGDFTFTNGTINANTSTSGHTSFAGGTAYILGSQIKFVNNGNATISSGSISIGNGGEFYNAGTFTATAGSIANDSGAPVGFYNAQNFIVALANSTASFAVNVPFGGFGNVSVTSGNLLLNDGTINNTIINGPFSLSAGCAVNFAAGTFDLQAGAETSGAGTVIFSGGAVSINFANISLNSAVLLSNGTLTAPDNTSNLLINGNFTFTNGTINLNTTATGDSTFSGNGDSITGNVTFTNAGNATITSGSIQLGGASTFHNTADFTATAGSLVHNPGSNLFLNDGNFTLNLANASSSFNAGVSFANHGTVTVNTGTLNLSSGDGTAGTTGVFDIAANANVNFSAGTFNFSSNATTTGGGTANFNGATINIGASEVFLYGNVTLSNGTVTGTTGALNLHGDFTFTNGTINANTSASGHTTFAGGIPTILGSQIQFVNNGNAVISSGAISIGNGAEFYNAGNFTATAGSIANDSGGPVGFYNVGNFTVALANPAASFAVNVPFAGFGNVSVTSGNLLLNGGTINNTIINGPFSLSAGCAVNFAAGTFDLQAGADASGAGTAIFSGGTVIINFANVSLNSAVLLSNGNITAPDNTSHLLINGSFTFSNGTVGVNTTAFANSTFSGGNGDYLTGAITFTNAGNATMTSGSIQLRSGASFNNTGTFTATAGSIQNNIAGLAFINNGAFIINLANSAGTFTVNVPFSNAGTVTITSGTLSLAAGDGTGQTTGSFNINAGAVAFSGGVFHFSPTATTTGPGLANFNGAIVNLAAPAVTLLSHVQLSNGQINGPGTLLLQGPLTWTSGTIAANTIASGNVMLAGGNVFLQSANFTATQSTTLTSGALQLGGGAQFINNGSFTASAGSIQNNIAGLAFINNGSFTINLSALPSTFTVNVPFSNNGTVNLLAGNLTLNSGDGGSTTGIFNVAAGTTLTLNGSFNFIGGNAYITGAGIVILNSAIAVSHGLSAGNLSINNSLQIKSNGGTSSFSALTLPGGNSPTTSFDLTNNKLIIEPSAASKASVLATLRAQVAYGKTHSTGIRSTALPPNTALALLDNAVTNFPTFGGLPVDSNSLLIAPELLGDANIDGHVDLTDLSTILNNFGTTTPAWTSGNFDSAPTIDLTDLSYVLNNFGLTNPNANSVLSTQSSAPPIPAPEPASLALFLATLPAIAAHRRGNKRE